MAAHMVRITKRPTLRLRDSVRRIAMMHPTDRSTHDIEVLANYLRQMDFFGSFPLFTLLTVASKAFYEHHERKDWVYEAGMESERIYFIMRGTADVMAEAKGTNGASTMKRIARKSCPQHFGEFPSGTDTTRKEGVVATSMSLELIALEKEHYEAMMEEFSSLN